MHSLRIPQKSSQRSCHLEPTPRASRMRSSAPLPPPLPLLPLLLHLLLRVVVVVVVGSEVGLAQQSAVFVTRQVQHASTPLRTVQGVSGVLCGLLCLWTADCLKWVRDPATAECRLLPLHSADNPLTAHNGTVHQRPHPPDYRPMPGGGGVTYRPHTRRTSAGQVLIQLCREDDPQAVPAFITTEDQFNFLKNMSMPFPHQWVSINDFQEEGVYKDLFNTTVVNIDNWISPLYGHFHNEANDGVVFSEGMGLKNRNFGDQYSYLCEYWM